MNDQGRYVVRVKAAMTLCALILAYLTSPTLIAAPADLPIFVANYLERTALEYETPRGRFDDNLLSFFEEQNDPEPWAIVADLNGDGISDWSGLLRDRAGSLVLMVVYSERRGFSHQLLTPLGLDGDDLYSGVVLERPGQITGFPLDNSGEIPEITIANPAVHLFYFEKASVLYYWNEGTFLDFVTSD